MNETGNQDLLAEKIKGNQIQLSINTHLHIHRLNKHHNLRTCSTGRRWGQI